MLGDRFTAPDVELPEEVRPDLEAALGKFGVVGSAKRMDDLLKVHTFSLQNAAEAFLMVQIDVIQAALKSKTLFAQMDDDHLRQLATGIASRPLREYAAGADIVTQ